MRVTAQLDDDAGRRPRREVGRHRQRRAAVERERRDGHPPIADRDQLRGCASSPGPRGGRPDPADRRRASTTRGRSAAVRSRAVAPAVQAPHVQVGRSRRRRAPPNAPRVPLACRSRAPSGPHRRYCDTSAQASSGVCCRRPGLRTGGHERPPLAETGAPRMWHDRRRCRSVPLPTSVLATPLIRRVAWHLRRVSGQLDRRFFLSLAEGILIIVADRGRAHHAAREAAGRSGRCSTRSTGGSPPSSARATPAS